MNVIIINGPMGVGKTTVGKYIADHHPGTAFIDGDWCLDLHPFVGNQETKVMAVDNILHMIGNYKNCSVCRMIVLVWLIDDEWVYRRIIDGICALQLELVSVTLLCGEEQLIQRWRQDKTCEWRTDQWLEISLKSLPHFSTLENCMDTSYLSISETAERIVQHSFHTGKEKTS